MTISLATDWTLANLASLFCKINFDRVIVDHSLVESDQSYQRLLSQQLQVHKRIVCCP